MSNLLSLDQSSTISGYAVFSEGKPIKVSHFSAGVGDIGKRLIKIQQKITELINQYSIDEVVFEDIQLHTSAANNVKTFKILAQVQGSIISLLEKLEIPYTIVQPSVWKSTFHFASKGRKIEKKAAQDWVLNNYNLTCTEDEADAACIGTHYLKQQEKPVFDWS